VHPSYKIGRILWLLFLEKGKDNMTFYNYKILPLELRNKCENHTLHMPYDLCMFRFMITWAPCLMMKGTLLAKHVAALDYASS
jgi:hypothetical protein